MKGLLNNGWLLSNGALKTLTSIPGWAQRRLDGGTGGDASQAYLSSAWAFRAVQLRADAVASAEIALYDRDGERMDVEHPILDVLYSVNGEWNASDLWRLTESAWCVYGAAYWHKVRAGNRVAQLFALNPRTMEVQAGADGIRAFRQTLHGKQTDFAREDVVYFRGAYDPASDLTGIAPLRLAISAALGERNAEQYLADFFANGATPALILSTDAQLPDNEIGRIAEWWRRLFRGKGNQHKTGIVGSGLKPHSVGTNPKDLALDEVRSAVHQTISTALGVPELLISPTNAADLTPVETAQAMFFENTVVPRWNWYAEVLNAELLPEYPDLLRQGAYLAFDYSRHPAMSENQTEIVARLSRLVESGIIRPEVAARELGYGPDDVPIAVVSPAARPAGGENESVLPAPADIARSADIERWQRKALNALGRGEAALVPFVSAALGEAERERINAGLAECKTADEVRAVFAAQPADELARANDLLERALKVLDDGE